MEKRSLKIKWEQSTKGWREFHQTDELVMWIMRLEQSILKPTFSVNSGGRIETKLNTQQVLLKFLQFTARESA